MEACQALANSNKRASFAKGHEQFTARKRRFLGQQRAQSDHCIDGFQRLLQVLQAMQHRRIAYGVSLGGSSFARWMCASAHMTVRSGPLAAASEPARRLMRVESIGPQTVTALVATVGDPHVFKNGRGFAAWLGITPRQYSGGGKERLGQITHQGDGYLRTLLVHGAANTCGPPRANVR
jgi:hypothetical protein